MSSVVKKVPYPPYVDKPINPFGKLNNGTNYGILDPAGVSYAHSMYGTLASTDAWFRRADVASLTPWGIGGAADGAYDGVIFRWMDYYAYEGIQPWSSGPWNPPGYGDGGAYVAKYGVGGINGCGEAIETSDGGARQLPMTAKQWRSFIWLSAAIAHRGGATSKTIREKLAFMQHREITTPSYKDCPFPRIYNYTNEYIAAIKKLMEYFEGVTNDINSLLFTIAGLSIDLRDVGRMRDNIPSPTPDPKPDPAPKPPAGGWTAGASIRAKKEVLGRQGPGLDFKTVLPIKAAEFVKIISGEVKTANGIDWIDVAAINGTGWVPKGDFELSGENTKPSGPIFHEFEKPRTFTVGPGGATLRRWGNRQSEILDNLKAGTKVVIDGYYDDGEEVDGSKIWLVQDEDPRGRIHSSGLKETI